MTGPEHYREAEHLLLAASAYDQDGAPQTAANRRAAALVHATLALAAATATAADVAAAAADIRNNIDLDDWADATAHPAYVENDEDPDEGVTASEAYELDQRDEAALDAAAAEAGEHQ